MGTESTRTGQVKTSTVIFNGVQFEVPEGVCNQDHEEGKTRWQRIAEIFETPEGVIFWSSKVQRKPFYAIRDELDGKPRWEAGRHVDLVNWGLGVGSDREYGSSTGPNRWSIWIDVGPFSWWLSREWPATKGQK